MKIAIGGLAIECCTFSPLLTELDEITILRDDLLRKQYPFLAHQSYDDVLAKPLIRGKSTPGGSVTKSAYNQIVDELLNDLRSGKPWDGVYLDLHGALHVDGMNDAEGHLVTSVREVVGPDVIIAASYDLHGNLSQGVVDHLDILTAYRTAPHIDVDETRSRAFRLLVDTLRSGQRPQTYFVPIPILLPGEVAMTTSDPAQSLYESLPVAINKHKLLDASYLVGYAWADEPRGCAAAVTVGTSGEQAQTAAQELAQNWWNMRANFMFGMPTGTPIECIEMAQTTDNAPTFISDAGDNITGGGVGDIPLLLEAMLEADLQNAVFAAIVDEEAVAICFNAGVGADVRLNIGGKLDIVHGQPLTVQGRVLTLYSDTTHGQQAVIQVAGVQVILTDRRVAFTKQNQFTQLDIDLTKKAVVGIKLGYLFPELREIAANAVLALTPGAINPDVHSIAYQHIQRPIYPLDPEMQWTAL